MPAHVVMLDDVAANVVLLRRILEIGAVGGVTGYTDPEAALAHCLADPPDALLLDLHMPGLDGFAFLAALHERLPAGGYVPVVVLTADVTTETRDRALRAGAQDFLTKPLDTVEVLLRVRNVVQTAQLYRAVNRHNAYLRRALDERLAHEREVAAARAAKVDRVSAVIAAGGPAVVFQPILATATGRLLGVEALARFAGEPLRPPDQWFTEAAEVGLGTQLELLAVRSAVAALPRLAPPQFLAVNVSPETVATAELAAILAADPTRIVVELTEHVPIGDYANVLDNLGRLRAAGVRVAVDDAGSGYAGLAMLVRVAPDIIKLDRDLVTGITADPCRRALASALVSFSADIGATLLAEGIEDAGELELLRRLGVPWGQGYHLGRPQALPALSSLPLGPLSSLPSGPLPSQQAVPAPRQNLGLTTTG